MKIKEGLKELWTINDYVRGFDTECEEDDGFLDKYKEALEYV